MILMSMVPFIPEKVNDKMTKDEFVKVTLKADQSSSVTGNPNMVKKAMKKSAKKAKKSGGKKKGRSMKKKK